MRADCNGSIAQSSAQSWARALELTQSIAREPDRIFSTVIEERAAQFGEAPALLSEGECFSYRELFERVNRYARWAIGLGLKKGDCVGLFMPNRPEFLAIWLGVTQAGGVVALLNTNLTGASLAHCINLVTPKHLIADAELINVLTIAMTRLTAPPAVWVHGASCGLTIFDREIQQCSAESLSPAERRKLTVEDPALYIYTSGTTGLPKAAIVSHGRLMQWTHWFAGLMGVRPADRMYNCLPMYHSVGGVQAPGAMLVGGGSVVLRDKFSARRFWSDIVRWDCTLFQYIGELCRYLLHSEFSPAETEHKIRMACGNGLRPDVWADFKNRFRLPRILEFYAATEGNVSLFNVEGEPGSIGRIPSYLAHRFPAKLVKVDVETGDMVLDEQGCCISCGPNETGEAIGQLLNRPSNMSSRFEGYTDPEASEKKIVRGAFRPGDAWFRTGDLMRRDHRGFFYFVDRIGDTFRWKGENVATSEVSEALCEFPGVTEANVYGIEIPGADGRACMATLVTRFDMDLTAFRTHLTNRLPEYARPMFLRIRNEMEVTATFKYTKFDLLRQGYNPAATMDPLYFNDPEREAFIAINMALYSRIQTGQIHLRRRRMEGRAFGD